jgi:hypothetical protein
MVEANLSNETYLTSLPPLQPAQCPFEMWEFFMPHPVFSNEIHSFINYVDLCKQRFLFFNTYNRIQRHASVKASSDYTIQYSIAAVQFHWHNI